MYQTKLNVEEFEPYLVAGVAAGDVHWINRNMSGIWRVSQGQLPNVIPYDFARPETIEVLEGAVRITLDDGHTSLLRRGDIAAYAKGTKSTWVFEELPFRKLFIHV